MLTEFLDPLGSGSGAKLVAYVLSVQDYWSGQCR